MKVAYHFICSNVEGFYDRKFYKILFNELNRLNQPYISSKILVGDLCVHNFFSKKTDPTDFLIELIQTQNETWKRITPENAVNLLKESVFIICFETIQKELAEKLHNSLLNLNNYIGAFEIDNSLELHWWLYGESLCTRYRILNKSFHILIDNNELESIEYANEQIDFFKKLLFDEVLVEYSNYRYSIFDDNHNYENAKRTSEWKKNTESLFETITDEIIAKLTDVAPELTNKLWAMTNAFTTAQTGEQYAQAMTSCRRIFEYVTDCLFPATNEIIDGHSLKKDKYKNRLIEFASREQKSESNINLILINTESLFEEWNKLYELSSKGVHSEPHRQECRRCILRTILLLDDIIAIRNKPFDVNINADSFINKIQKKL